MENQYDIYRGSENIEKLTPKQKLIFQSAIDLFPNEAMLIPQPKKFLNMQVFLKAAFFVSLRTRKSC